MVSLLRLVSTLIATIRAPVTTACVGSWITPRILPVTSARKKLNVANKHIATYSRLLLKPRNGSFIQDLLLQLRCSNISVSERIEERPTKGWRLYTVRTMAARK